MWELYVLHLNIIKAWDYQFEDAGEILGCRTLNLNPKLSRRREDFHIGGRFQFSNLRTNYELISWKTYWAQYY